MRALYSLILFFVMAACSRAAIVTRYFGVTGSGAADGTTWADRAALFSSGNWSSVITGFDFSGSDSLMCLIGPGTHSCGQALASGLFSNAPTAANPLILHGCDGTGNPLTPPDPGWVSAMPAWDDSALPVIATTTNVQSLGASNSFVRLIKFTASGRNGPVILSNAGIDWCVVVQNTANTSAGAATAGGPITNCVLSCSGSIYDVVLSTNALASNNRCIGVTGSSGNRIGIASTSGTSAIVGNTSVGCGGSGIASISGSATQSARILSNTVVACGGDGIKGHSTASQTVFYLLLCNYVANCGGYGINGNSDAIRAVVSGNRMRDNTSGNITGIGNYPTTLDNYVADSDDATEFVDASNGDYRIKNAAAIWGKGYGAGDEPASGGGLTGYSFTWGF